MSSAMIVGMVHSRLSNNPSHRRFRHHDYGSSAPLGKTTAYQPLFRNMIVLSTFMVFVALLVACSQRFLRKGTNTDDCNDVSIIGAGLAGTYAAWRLRNAKLDVSVYEYSDRVGGMYVTVPFPNEPSLYADLGGMRYLPQEHQMLDSVIKKLQLTIVPFTFGGPTLYYRRGKRFTTEDIWKVTNIPYKLQWNESMANFQLLWELFTTKTNFSGCYDNLQFDVLFLVSEDGQSLSDQTFAEFVQKQVTREGFEYLYDTYHSYSVIFLEMASSVAYSILKTHGVFDSPVVKTIKGGMQKIPIGLLSEFQNDGERHNVFFNKKLVSIQKMVGASFLTFQRTKTMDGITTDTKEMETVCSKKVLLAIPVTALKQIIWEEPLSDDIRHSMNAAYSAFGCKIYLVYEYAWWLDTPGAFNNTRSHLSIGDSLTLNLPNDGNRTVLIATYQYNKMEYLELWKTLQTEGKPLSYPLLPNRVTDRVVSSVHDELAIVHGIKASLIPYPLDGLMAIWNSSNPMAAGVNVWNKGFNYFTTRQSLERIEQDNIFIASSSFALPFINKWGEGALYVVDGVLRRLNLFDHK